MLRLVKFVVYLAVSCHTVACAWHYILSTQEDSNTNSQIVGNIMNDKETYMYSLYFILVTFATVGYGDIIPQTNHEIFFNMLIEFIGILIFAYLMGNLSNILLSTSSHKTLASDKSNDLDKWLMRLNRSRSDRKFPIDVYNYVSNYYDYIWKHDFSQLQSSEFMYRIPHKLREKLIRNLLTPMINNFECFFRDCDEKLCYSLVMNMHPRRFEKHEEIISIDQEVTDVYFISAGQVAVGTKHGTQLFLKLPQYSFFGEEFVIFNSVSPMAFIAMEKLETLYIQKDAFLKLVKQFPNSMHVISVRAFKRGVYFRAEMYKYIKTVEQPAIETLFQRTKTGIDLILNSRTDANKILQQLNHSTGDISEELLNHIQYLLKISEPKKLTAHEKYIKKLHKTIHQYQKSFSKQSKLTDLLLSSHQTLLSDIESINSGLNSSKYSKVIKTLKRRI